MLFCLGQSVALSSHPLARLPALKHSHHLRTHFRTVRSVQVKTLPLSSYHLSNLPPLLLPSLASTRYSHRLTSKRQPSPCRRTLRPPQPTPHPLSPQEPGLRRNRRGPSGSRAAEPDQSSGMPSVSYNHNVLNSNASETRFQTRSFLNCVVCSC